MTLEAPSEGKNFRDWGSCSRELVFWFVLHSSGELKGHCHTGIEECSTPVWLSVPAAEPICLGLNSGFFVY